MKRTRYLVFTIGFSAALGAAELGVNTHVESIQPFTHSASLPATVDPATIRFEKVKATKVATTAKYASDSLVCSEQRFRDPGGSMYCPSEERADYVPAYEVTYSYAGTKDIYGSVYSTFTVYFRPEEVAPALQQALAARKLKRAESAEYFKVSTLNEPVQRVVYDGERSSFCAGRPVDGIWMQDDPQCKNKISYKTVTLRADSLAVRVEPVTAPAMQAKNRIAGQ